MHKTASRAAAPGVDCQLQGAPAVGAASPKSRGEGRLRCLALRRATPFCRPAKKNHAGPPGGRRSHAGRPAGWVDRGRSGGSNGLSLGAARESCAREKGVGAAVYILFPPVCRRGGPSRVSPR